MNNILSSLTRLERGILEHLSERHYTTVSLCQEMVQKKIASKQAIYRSMASLKQKDIISSHKREILLSPVWTQELEDFSKKIRFISSTTYKQMLDIVSQNSPKNKASYVFTSFKDADIFWSHAGLSMLRESDPKLPTCFYNPHQFFLALRPQLELGWIKQFKDFTSKTYLAIGNITPLDYELRKIITLPEVSYLVTGDKISSKDEFINVIGDCILTARLSNGDFESVHAWFVEHKKITPSNKLELENTLYTSNKKIKITLERNPEKAAKLRARILKRFH